MSDKNRVAIIGSGPSGLAAAIELGARGIPCVIFERRVRAGYAPRAKTTHTRTREHLRRWGIAGKLADASPFGIDYPSNVVYVTRLGGELIHRFENALQCAPTRNEHYSEHGQWIPQYKLEAVLREHALSLPCVEIVHGQEFIGYDEDEAGLAVRLRDSESRETRLCTASYLIGADGAHSTVRDAIGAKMVGTHGLSRNYNIIFRAPGLAVAHPHGPGIMFAQINEDVPSLIGPMDKDDLWYFMPTGLPPGTIYSNVEAVEAIRRSTGIDLPYEILSSDEWVASRLLADRYRRRKVFLSGDACHLHPPFGGFGMNMGVADSIDLGWKIASVLQGWGGEALLDSYEIERRSAHEFVLDESEANHAASPNMLYRRGLEDDTPEGEQARREVEEVVVREKTAEFYAQGVLLGHCYRGSPVILNDGDASRCKRSRDYVPCSAAGCLAPHRWLAGDVSLYDLFGEGFTLLAVGPVPQSSIDAAKSSAAATGTPLKVVRVDDPEVQALYDLPLTLIRPDQHISWRGTEWAGDDLLLRVTGRPDDWARRKLASPGDTSRRTSAKP